MRGVVVAKQYNNRAVWCLTTCYTGLLLALMACGDTEADCVGALCSDATFGTLGEIAPVNTVDTTFGQNDSHQTSDGITSNPDGTQGSSDTDSDTTGLCTPAVDGCCDLELWERELDLDCRQYVVFLDAVAVEAAPLAIDFSNRSIHLVFRRVEPPQTVYQRRSMDDGALSYELSLGTTDPLCPVVLPNGDVVVMTQTQVLRITPDAQTPVSVVDLPSMPTTCPTVLGSLLVVPLLGTVAGIDLDQSTVRWTWTAPVGEDISAPAAVNPVADGVVVATSSGRLWFLNAQDGTAVESKSATFAISVGNPVPVSDAGWVVAGSGAKSEAWIGRWDWQTTTWSLPKNEPLLALPGVQQEPIVGSNGSLFISKAGGGVLNIDPTTVTLQSNPANLSHVRTAPVMLDGGVWVVGTTAGIETFVLNGTDVQSRWRYNIDEPVSQAPLVLPTGDVVLLGPNTLVRVQATESPLAKTPWPRVRGGWHNLGVAQ